MLEIIEKCREAESSEVKSLGWSEMLSNAEFSEVQYSEVNEASEAEWGEVKCNIGKGGGGSLYGKGL